MSKFIVRLAAAIGLLIAITSAADATCVLTSLTNGTTADASAVMTNFNCILGSPNFTGNVGIGTTSPTTSLAVSDGGANGFEVDPVTISPSTYLTTYNRTTSAYTAMDFRASTFSFLSDGSTQGLYQDSSGNVGIGTTSPSALLSLGSAETTIKVAAFDGGGSAMYGMGVNADELTFGAGIGVGGTPQLVLMNTGNVGIGTTSPASALDVAGMVRSTAQAIPASGAGIEMSYAGGQGYIDAYDRSGSAYKPLLISGAPVLLNASGQGNVGIGTTSPSSALQVNGSGAAATDFSVTGRMSTGDSSNDGGVWVNSGHTLFVGQDGSSSIGIYDSGWRLVVASGGDVGIGTTSPGYLLQVGSSSVAASTAVLGLEVSGATCTHTPTSSAETVSCSSDARLKKEIVDASPALPEISDMRVRDFTVRATGERKTGVIAQELLKTHPEMVHMGPDGFYTVDGPNPWKLVKAIQELKSANDAQASQIARQNQELADLKRENALLKSSASTTDRRLEAIEARLGIRAASLDRAPMRASGNHE